MKIIDNALNEEDFLKIKYFMMNECDWYFSENVVSEQDKVFPYSYFIHNIFQLHENYQFHLSNSYQLMIPIIKILNPLSIVRIKSNMYINQNNLIEHGTHIDSERSIKAAVYYVNSNNGKTIFESGEEIESVENRLVIFDANHPHRSTNCTDEWRRITVNFNYV
jgi:hypothetical protein